MINDFINKYPTFRRLAAALVLLILPLLLVFAIIRGSFDYVAEYVSDLYHMITVEAWSTVKGLFKTITTGSAF